MKAVTAYAGVHDRRASGERVRESPCAYMKAGEPERPARPAHESLLDRIHQINCPLRWIERQGQKYGHAKLVLRFGIKFSCQRLGYS